MAGLCSPLPTLRRRPRGRQRTARGRCRSLLLHRSGLAPPTPCRSPGALRILPAPPRIHVFGRHVETRRNRVPSPAILVGHSYGGTLITHAGTDARVAALVYI